MAARNPASLASFPLEERVLQINGAVTVTFPDAGRRGHVSGAQTEPCSDKTQATSKAACSSEVPLDSGSSSGSGANSVLTSLGLLEHSARVTPSKPAVCSPAEPAQGLPMFKRKRLRRAMGATCHASLFLLRSTTFAREAPPGQAMNLRLQPLCRRPYVDADVCLALGCAKCWLWRAPCQLPPKLV